MKKLVIFYSLTGNTRFVAGAISRAIDAETLELQTAEEPGSRGFMRYFWGGRQVMMKEEPALLPLDKDPSEYDLLIIGTPVWAFTYAPALASFFSKTKLQGKKIALFCCSHGGKGGTLEKMKARLEGNEFVGQIGFVEPLRGKEKNAEKAKAWAQRMPTG